MADQAKNILIGIFVIAACAIIIFVMLFLHPSVGDEGQIINVRFADIDKVTIGTRVTYAGKPVGEVIDIRPINESPEKMREGVDGIVYVYELILRMDSHVKVYNTDQIFLRTSGLLGERSIEVSPEPIKPDQKLILVNGQVLYANGTSTIEDTLKQLKTVAEKFGSTVDAVKSAVDQFNQLKIVTKVDKTVQHLLNITNALDNPKMWSESLANLHTLTEKFNPTWERVDQSIAKLDQTLNNIQVVTDETRNGRGSLGRIFMKDDLYLQLTSMLSKGQTLFDDINHYGLLYQNDKRWQRLRARRANLLYKLSSPQEFRNYFNDELDQIMTSLSRISMVIDEKEVSCCPEDFMEGAEFRGVFAELLRRVKDMEESLKVYNEQLVDRDLGCELITY